MFTGIIECMGTVLSVQQEGSNVHFTIDSRIGSELKIDQSVAHNGVCLTVVALNGTCHTVTAIKESLDKSNLRHLKEGDKVNLERCLPYNGRLDGHVVQGHVDQTGKIRLEKNENGSWHYIIEHQEHPMFYTIDKGSVCVNGVSLTCHMCSNTGFSVSIIPYTYEQTNFHCFKNGDEVNLEFDILGKYVQQHLYKMGLAKDSSSFNKFLDKV